MCVVLAVRTASADHDVKRELLRWKKLAFRPEV